MIPERITARIRGLAAVVGTLLRLLRLVAFLALDSLCRLTPAARANTAIVVRLDAIGDFFMWLQSGAVDASRYARASGREAVLLANCAWADYARQTGLWDRVVAVEPRLLMRRPLYRLRVMWRVRRLGARLLIQPRAARVFLQEDTIARVSGAEIRIGNAGTLINITPRLRRLGNCFYHKVVTVDELRTTHEIIRNSQFVSGLTGRPATKFKLFHTHAAAEPFCSIIVALGAGQSGRIWPVAKLAELLTHIRNTRPDLRIVLLGAHSDRYLAATLRELLGSGLDDRVGKTDLHEYVTAIQNAKLVICNDSSAYHIAMACDKKVLCFLGGGHYGWYAPYPSCRSRDAIVLSVEMSCFWCNWNCRYPRADGGAFRCVASISVKSAVESVEALLTVPTA